MSKSARYYFLLSLIVQILIVVIAGLVYKPLIQADQIHRAKFSDKQLISRIIKLAQKKQYKVLKRFGNRPQTRRVDINISSKPENTHVLQLEEFKQFYNKKNALKQLSYTFKLDDEKYLNINLKSPPSEGVFQLARLGLLVFVLFSLFIVNYLTIKKVNKPIKLLLDSLDYAQKSNDWPSLPLLGEEEQNTIFAKVNDLIQTQKNVLKERMHLIAAISHDLRTPLSRIKLRSEYFAQHEQYPKLIEDIDEMEYMLSESLNYFRDNSYNEPLQSFDLLLLLEAIASDIDTDESAVQLKSNVSKIIMSGHFNQLKRAFTNIIVNAIKYGDCAQITVKKTKNEVAISIVDQGKGIDPSKLEQVFQPFYRVDKSRSRTTGGTGLGLTIAKDIFQLHNGHIYLNNHPSAGLIVEITLPIKQQ